MANTPSVASLAIPDPGDPLDPSGRKPSSGRDTLKVRAPIPQALRTLWRDRPARVAATFLFILSVAAIGAPWIAPFDPARPLDPVGLQHVAPTARHLFGTDHLSRDVLSRVLFGARVSLAVSVLAALLASAVGLLYGGLAGFAGGRIDGLLMRLVDTCLAIPRILLLLTVLALWGQVDAPSLILLLGVTGWFAVARLARAEALALRGRDFVSAARALGTPPGRIFVRHVLPHLLGPVLVATTIAMGHVVVLEAGLSYLGYGIPQPTPTWGNIIRDGRETIATTWWMTLFPGLALVGTALATNTLADRLRSALNPRQLPAP